MKASLKTDSKTLIAQLRRNKVMTAQELAKYAAGRVVLRRMADAGQILSLGSGLYATPTLDPFVAAIIAVSKYYPRAVISNLTAMSVHGLTDERIDQIDVDVERSRTIRNKLIKCHRVPKKRLNGTMKLSFHGEEIRVYDKERALCEAYRIDPGGPIFFKALKRYLKQQAPNTTKLQDYDRVLGTKVIGHLQQELADG